MNEYKIHDNQPLVPINIWDRLFTTAMGALFGISTVGWTVDNDYRSAALLTAVVWGVWMCYCLYKDSTVREASEAIVTEITDKGKSHDENDVA